MTKSSQSSILQMIQRGRDLIGSLLFPQRCPVCDEILEPELVGGWGENTSHFSGGIHPACKEKLLPVKEPFCLHCGRPMAETSSQEYCSECIRIYGVMPYSKEIINSSITSARALYLYQGAIKKSMYRFKYSNKREYADFFAEEAVEKYMSWIQKNQIDVIVPVPMYARKKKVRGYNQAESFARALSERTGIPVDDNLIKRVRDTVPQKGLSDLERKNNMKNAFQKAKSIVQYSHVLVVDDIYTTGSTVEAVAQEIKNEGDCQVYALSICIGRDM